MTQAQVQVSNHPPFQIMLCGSMRSGKTQLCNALQGKEYSLSYTHTSSIDTYDTSMDDESKVRFLDFASSYDDLDTNLRKHYVNQSKICVICIDRQKSDSFEAAQSIVEDIRKVDPNKKIPIIIALTKEDQNTGLPDYEILVKDKELDELMAKHDLIGPVKTIAAHNQEGTSELRKALLKLRQEIIVKETIEEPNISSLEEYTSLIELEHKINNLYDLFRNAEIELIAQNSIHVALTPNTPEGKKLRTEAIESINKSIEAVSKFSHKLLEIGEMARQVDGQSDKVKRDNMVKEYELSFNEFAHQVNSELLTINPPKNVKNLLLRLIRAPFIGFHMYTDKEQTEVQRFKHQVDFKEKLQKEEGRFNGQNSKDAQQQPENDDSESDSGIHPKE